MLLFGLGLMLIFILTNLLVSNSAIIKSAVFKNFSDDVISASFYATPESTILQTLKTNATYRQEFNNLSINPQLFSASVESVKIYANTNLNNVFGLLLEIVLFVSTTLLGLYTLFFVEFIKLLFKRGSQHEYAKYCLLLIAAVPFAFLLSSLLITYATFDSYGNLSSSVANYLAIIPQVIPNSSTYIPNSIAYFALTNTSVAINKYGILTSSIPITPNFLYNQLGEFFSISPEVLVNLKIGLFIIIFNLFLYYLLYIFTRSKK